MSVKPEVSTRINIDFALANDLSVGAIERGVRAATVYADGVLVDLLSQPGQGKIYGDHRASKPGDPPAVDSGDLRRNRSMEVTRTPGGAEGVLALNMEYAEALEIGTEHIEPRPSIGRIPIEYGKRLLEVFIKFGRLGN
jgi:hypothetical protein